MNFPPCANFTPYDDRTEISRFTEILLNCASIWAFCEIYQIVLRKIPYKHFAEPAPVATVAVVAGSRRNERCRWGSFA
jgi:hypothetical protein